MTIYSMQAIGLIAFSAIGYSVATIGLKMGATTLGLASVGVIVLGFGMATLAELEVLRRLDLGIVYISIIGLETLLVLGYAWWIGEALNLRQLGGAALVLTGLAVVSH